MENSILTSLKKLLGIERNYIHFDTDILMHINSIFSTLNQLGIGPEEGFSIVNKDSKWEEFESRVPFNMLKSYMYLRLRLLFDPPQNSFLVNSMEKQISELEWRLVVRGDTTV